jgi:hypothetical protein
VPGVVLPKGRANGVLAVDGFILYEPAYDHETPSMPLDSRSRTAGSSTSAAIR